MFVIGGRIRERARERGKDSVSKLPVPPSFASDWTDACLIVRPKLFPGWTTRPVNYYER